MPRPRRSVKKAPIIESDSSSEEDVPNKKQKLFQVEENKTNEGIEKGAETVKDESSSSESDIENYLQPINKLDFSSSFFNLKKDNDEEFGKIEKNIFDSVKVSTLSDSESDLEETKSSIGTENQESNTEVEKSVEESSKLNFKQLEAFTKTIEEAKLQVEKYNAKKKIKEKNLDVSNILAEGESKKLTLENIRAEDLHSSDFQTTDDEDWEEVKIKEQEEKPIVPKRDIEIRIGEMPDHCKKKKGVDLLAAMKRRLNRIRKENQIYVHKVHLLCWIAHGNFVNSVINNSEILGSALTLLPSDKCYPSDRIDLSYLEQIVQWYKKTMTLTEKAPHQQLTLINALRLQIKRKEVYDKKMLVLIFIAILRSLGIQCRMVLSFQVEPLRPPASELHSLSTKDTNKKVTGSKSGKSTSQNKSLEDIKPNTSLQESVKTDKPQRLKVVLKSCDKKTSEVQERIRRSDGNSLSTKDEKNKTADGEKAAQEGDKMNTRKENKKNKLTEEKVQNKKLKREEDKKVGRKTTTDDVKKQIADGEGDKMGTRKENKKNKLSEGNVQNKKLKSKEVKKVEVKSITDGEDDEMSKRKSNEKNKLSEGNVQNRKLKSKEDKRVAIKSKTEDVRTTRSKSAKISETTTNEKLKKEIPQLDGANDDVNKKPNLKKLKNKLPEKVCPKKSHSKQSSKPVTKNDDSESEFSNSPTKKSPEKKLNFSKLKQLDVKSDIVNLIKGRIAEQKHTDRSRMVKKRKSKITDSDSDSDYMPEPIKKKHHDSDSDIEYFIPKPKVKKRVSVKRVAPGHPILSNSDDETAKKKKKGNNVWIEVFLESEEKWITVDVVRGQVHCVNELYMRATHPISYVVAWNNDNTIKDVTKRYCTNYNTVTRKLRINEKWWEESIRPFLEKSTPRSREEDNDLSRQQLDQPLPKVISEYKNHPLYALRRHLLKFEEIYPPDTIPLGYVRSEPVYPRNCVYVCKSREIWLKEAKVVKAGEKPYKVVKARPKYDRLSNTMITDQLLEIFGEWQTKDYEPPTAENGIVPRNAFGNVELFKPCMLPKKTVHLKLPGLNKICKRMNIDCATAIVGFDFHGGWSHPVYDGFVVCEEYADTLVAAWDMEQQEIEKKENEKIEKRVYTNWKKLIKGLLIRERLKARYDFGGETSGKGKQKSKSKKGSKPVLKKGKIISDSDSDSD
ncbi:DNA repair protein complementing XP-C cells homolog [Diorhabda sublineata]|uniref:DNA repair protein complementing XP-C cells homolog n=1 Tax=Diorhabda sublineata TaxID=1163346 RepID=UPI0024E15567|nr:DNA repair protein complementing XP-C cells homolog [Diorhabda sublineata]